MRLEVVPEVSYSELAAIERALAGSEIRLDPALEIHLTPWSRAALREAVDTRLPTRYARSPRNTRGATRA